MTVELKLTEELMHQYRKAFSVYGKEEDGKISPKDLGIVMRSLGYNPTESELQVSIYVETFSIFITKFNVEEGLQENLFSNVCTNAEINFLEIFNFVNLL